LKAGPSRSTKAFFDMCIKLLGMEKKMDTHFRRNSWKLLKKSINSNARDWLRTFIYQPASGLYLTGHILPESTDTNCRVTYKTEVVKLGFCDKAPRTWSQTFVSYCSQ
jgi:hypothetical protein